MHFGLSDDQKEIQVAARDLLGRRSGFDVVRAHAERRQLNTGLGSELAQLGWPGIAVDGDFGGGGLGLVEAAILVEAHGNAMATTGLFGTIAAAALLSAAGSDEQKRTWLPGLASGEFTGAVGNAELMVDPSSADVAIVYTDTSAELVYPGDIEIIETIDPTRSYGRITKGTRRESLGGNSVAGVAAVAVLTAAELVGIAARSLELTVDYVKKRQQFSKVVASFQAVSHRCVQMLVAVESARTATYFGAWAVHAAEANAQHAVAMAKALAGDSAREVSGAAIQLHGGIGFTWEADLHWLYKRAQLMSALLGSGRVHRAELARLAAAELAGTR